MTTPVPNDSSAAPERAPDTHPECYAYVKDGLARLGVDANVSTAPPIFATPYEDLGLICPHGVRFYAEPTSEQRAQWARDGVA